jgi:fructosamine-3-kinase
MSDVRSILSRLLDAEVVALRSLGGGDVADSYRVTLGNGDRVFAKTKRAAPPEFFITEAAGLAWLRDAAAVPIPDVLAVSDDPAMLVLEWIEPGGRHHSTEADFGRALAALHAAGGPHFGREDRRSTGSRGLPNEPAETWADFYADNRLRPLARLAADAGALPSAAIRRLEEVAGHVADLVGPVEGPARLHGDLWGGNRMVGSRGVSWLIDPAAFGGHREFDLAMMRLFGGFGEDCYAAYAEVAPLAADWGSRIPLHQLAPLVVHAIKFGGSYVGATERALDLVQ